MDSATCRPTTPPDTRAGGHLYSHVYSRSGGDAESVMACAPDAKSPKGAKSARKLADFAPRWQQRSADLCLVPSLYPMTLLAGLPSGMVSGPRRRLEPTLAGSLVVLGCGNTFIVFRQSFSSCKLQSGRLDGKRSAPERD